MVAITSGSGIWPFSRLGCSEVATISLCLCWRPSSALAAAREAAMKPLGSAAQGISGVGSSAGHFLFSLAILFSLVLEGPTEAYCHCRAGCVEGEGLEVPA